MSEAARIRILPYSYIVGQEELKLALELNYTAPAIGGVLVTGRRGTAKSTLVRAFSLMSRGELPVTLPINATDDRVLGGWNLDALMRGEAKEQPGLLEEADEKGLLYIDEVNLLDDHIVNIILDVVSTGVLTVQREAIDIVKRLSFGLVGTMNPEEGGLRPQLLDRFGLMATATELATEDRKNMVLTVLRFDDEAEDPQSSWVAAGIEQDGQARRRLEEARATVRHVRLSDDMAMLCTRVAAGVGAVGHRGEFVTALAARALAALEGGAEVLPRHVRKVAPMTLRHRRPESVHGTPAEWDAAELAVMDDLFE